MLAAAVVVVMALMPNVYANDLLLFNFVMFLTLSQGLNIIYGFTGYLPFGYVGFFGAGAYGFAIVGDELLAPPPLVAMAVGAVAAVVLALVLIPLMRLSGAYFAIANLAAAQAVYQVVSNPALEDVTKGPYGVSLSGRVRAALLLHAWRSSSWRRRSGWWCGCATRASVWPCRRSARTRSVPRWRACPSCASAPSPGCFRRWSPAWWAACSPGTSRCSIPDTAFDVGISIFATVFTLFGGAATLTGPILGVRDAVRRSTTPSASRCRSISS